MVPEISTKTLTALSDTNRITLCKFVGFKATFWNYNLGGYLAGVCASIVLGAVFEFPCYINQIPFIQIINKSVIL